MPSPAHPQTSPRAEVADIAVNSLLARHVKAPRALGGRASRAMGAYGLLLPSLVGLALFTYAPVVQVAWDSVHARRAPGIAPGFAGLANYHAILADAAFRKAAINNLYYALGTIIPSLLIALGLALALARSDRINNLLRTAFFMPVLIPLVAAASLFLFIFLPNVGLLDFYIGRFLAHPPNWLGDPDVALYSIMALTVWKNAGYYMLFFLAGLQAVPHEAYEAAYLEGATPWQRLWHVTLPYLQPTTGFVTVIALINVVTQVDHVFVLTKGGPSDSTNLLLFYVYQQAVESYDIGKAAAGTLVSLAVLMAVTAVSLGTLERAFGGRP
jgi:sn-glycerol 3-phosphate transport system permease protein